MISKLCEKSWVLHRYGFESDSHTTIIRAVVFPFPYLWLDLLLLTGLGESLASPNLDASQSFQRALSLLSTDSHDSIRQKSTSYEHFVRAKNNCMSTDQPAMYAFGQSSRLASSGYWHAEQRPKQSQTHILNPHNESSMINFGSNNVQECLFSEARQEFSFDSVQLNWLRAGIWNCIFRWAKCSHVQIYLLWGQCQAIANLEQHSAIFAGNCSMWSSFLCRHCRPAPFSQVKTLWWDEEYILGNLLRLSSDLNARIARDLM